MSPAVPRRQKRRRDMRIRYHRFQPMPGGELSGKTVIVTGGGRGIGRATALGLARAGANVVITAAHHPSELDGVVDEAAKLSGAGSVRGIVSDVAGQDDCCRVVSETLAAFGAVHILVNNAGRGMRFVSEKFFSTPTKFWQTDPAVWRMIVDTNVNGPFLMSRAVVPRMVEQRWGRIINISINHETMRRAGFSPYGRSKAALESETIIWAQELAGTGVTVNSMLPGGATTRAWCRPILPRRRAGSSQQAAHSCSRKQIESLDLDQTQWTFAEGNAAWAFWTRGAVRFRKCYEFFSLISADPFCAIAEQTGQVSGFFWR